VATLQRLGEALLAADAAGNTDDARELAQAIRGMMASQPAEAPKDTRTLAEVPLEAAMNLPKSAAQAAYGLAQAVMSPVQTAKTLADAAAGGLRAGAQAVLPQKLFEAIDALDNPQTTERISQTANAVGGIYKERYGDWEAVKRTMATDPVGFVADASTLLTGAGLAARGASAGARVAGATNAADTIRSGADTAMRAAATIDPLGLAVRGGAAGARAVAATPLVTAPTNVLAPWLAPKRAAANALIEAAGGDGQQIINALRASKDMPMTPGAAAPTLSERLVAGGAPSVNIAGFEAGVADASPKIAAEIFARRQQTVSAIQAQLARIDDQIKASANVMSPQVTQLKQVRDSLLQTLAAERAGATAQGAGVAQALPDASPQAIGQALTERGTTLRKAEQARTVTPAYERAFSAAGDARMDVATIAGQIEDILREPLHDLVGRKTSQAAEAVSRIMDRIEPRKPRPAPAAPADAGPAGVTLGRAAVQTELDRLAAGVGKQTRSAVAAAERAARVQTKGATLRELDEIRAAINKDVRAASGSADPSAAARYRELMQVQKSLDDVVASSGLPKQAKDLYGEALRVYREDFAPRFKQGPVVKTTRYNSVNQPQLLPDKVVDAFLANETQAAQFVRTYAGDPAATNAMQQGVLSAYRDAITDPATGLIKPGAAAKFADKYGRQIDALEQSGVGVKAATETAMKEATEASSRIENLVKETSGWKQAQNAAEVVDLGLKSPAAMTQLRNRLSPEAAKTLAGELTNRAMTLIRNNDPDAALKYLNEHSRAIRIGLGKSGASDHGELVRMAQFQKEFAEVAKQAPKMENLSPVTLNKTFSPKELTDLAVVADDLKRMRQVEELALGGRVAAGAAGEMASAAAGNLSAKKWPMLFSPLYTNIKNRAIQLESAMNRKVGLELFNLLVKDPDAAIPLIEKSIAKTKRRQLNIGRAPNMTISPVAVGGGVAGEANERVDNAMAR